MIGFVLRFQETFHALSRSEDLFIPVTPEELLDMKKTAVVAFCKNSSSSMMA